MVRVPPMLCKPHRVPECPQCMKGKKMAGKCEHGLTTKECFVCASPKYGAHKMAPVTDWPPRFTFTPDGIAGLFLRKHFATASGEHQQELAALLRYCVEQEREACAKTCEALQVNKSPDYFPGAQFDGACRTCADEIRKRSNSL